MRQHVLDNPLSYYAIFLFTRYVPIHLCYWLGKIVVSIIYAFSSNDRKGLAYNLSLALKMEPDDPSIKKTVRSIFMNYGRYMIDFFYLPHLPPHKIKRSFSHLKGEDVLKRALAKGKGAILISAHVGNWEFGGTMMRLSDYPLAVVAMAHNASATNRLINRVRNDKGIKVIEVDKSVFSGLEAFQHLRKNGIVAMIGDKDFFEQGRLTNFFDQRVRFPLGPVVLAMKTGAALIPAFVFKQPDGRYFGVLEQAIPLITEGKREDVIDTNLGMTARVFEKYIRLYPDQWYCPTPITLPSDSLVTSKGA